MDRNSLPSKRRLFTLAAIAAPGALGLSILISYFTWEAPTITIPKMCIEAYSDGEVQVSEGACPVEELEQI